jgi:hypothetical protein
VRQIAIGLLLIIASCRPTPIRTGPLPAAHSCYVMSGPLLPYAEARSDSVWLLLSDQSPRRFGARAFDALILRGDTKLSATWHSIARDSLQVEWATSAGAQSVVFRETPAGIEGHAPANGGAVNGADMITGRRADCMRLADR